MHTLSSQGIAKVPLSQRTTINFQKFHEKKIHYRGGKEKMCSIDLRDNSEIRLRHQGARKN